MKSLRLFIIGNGFDLAHKMPTSFQDFDSYLRTAYPGASEENAEVPPWTIGNHGDVIYDNTDVVSYLLNLLARTNGKWWNDFERTLGELDFDPDFDDLPWEFDRDGDRNLWHEAYNNEDLASSLAGCVPMISGFFSDWIDTISISKVAKRRGFSDLIDPEHDLFLTFNYTRVLEHVYGISEENICHIHGAQGEPLIIGHGTEQYETNYIGAEEGLGQIHEALRKDTDAALQAHYAFFNRLSSGLSDVFSYGFSFNDVDQVYIRQICSCMDTHGVQWHLHSFGTDQEKQKETIRSCGFRGSFSIFDA